MSKSSYIKFGLTAIIIILFGLFIYPTIYKYDKFNQKIPIRINRITGTTEMFSADGWTNVGATKTEMDDLRTDLDAKLKSDRDSIKQEIINQITSQIVKKVQTDIDAAKKQVTDYRKFETDPSNYFSLGSTKDEVKSVMGTPTGTYKADYGGYETWNYGLSTIKFVNNKVTEYQNVSENLRVK